MLFPQTIAKGGWFEPAGGEDKTLQSVFCYQPITSPLLLTRPVLPMKSPALASRTVPASAPQPAQRASFGGQSPLLAFRTVAPNPTPSPAPSFGGPQPPLLVQQLQSRGDSRAYQTKRQAQDVVRRFLQSLAPHFPQLEFVWDACFAADAQVAQSLFFGTLSARVATGTNWLQLQSRLDWLHDVALQSEIFLILCLCNRECAAKFAGSAVLLSREKFFACLAVLPHNQPHFACPVAYLDSQKVFDAQQVAGRLAKCILTSHPRLPDYNLSDMVSSEELQMLLGPPFISKGLIETAMQTLLRDNENRRTACHLSLLLDAAAKHLV